MIKEEKEKTPNKIVIGDLALSSSELTMQELAELSLEILKDTNVQEYLHYFEKKKLMLGSGGGLDYL